MFLGWFTDPSFGVWAGGRVTQSPALPFQGHWLSAVSPSIPMQSQQCTAAVFFEWQFWNYIKFIIKTSLTGMGVEHPLATSKQGCILCKYFKAWASLISVVCDSCSSGVCPDSCATFQVICCLKSYISLSFFGVLCCLGFFCILVLYKEMKYVTRFKTPPLI